MIERLVENWLTSTGERGYEVPFAQLLAAEEHRIIQGPVHHPFEHGKDILTVSPDGELHAYQLKGPNFVKLEDFEEIQGQLMALAAAAVTHPAVTPARRADRVFLVTNSVLTPPVTDRISKFNIGNATIGLPPIEPIERDQLVSRFVLAHGRYLPQALHDVRTLIELYYSDPLSAFPVRLFAGYLSALLPFPPQQASIPDCRKAVASVALITGYAASSWTRSGNHFCVAQAWLTACLTLLRFAAVRQLNQGIWLGTYQLAFEAARTAIASLAKETAESKDLIVPDLVDGFVYPSRALLVCGLLSAYHLSERTLGAVDPCTADYIRAVLQREARYAKLVGECDVPSALATAVALEHLGEIGEAERLILSVVHTISRLNQRHSRNALAAPYHDTEQVLLHRIGANSTVESEEFDGRSYMLHVGIEWLARRLLRQHLAAIWTDISRIELLEFQPSSPEGYLAVEDKEGELKMRLAGQPQSWSKLLEQARDLDRTTLPALLWSRREMMPYLPLLFPYRLTTALSRAIDAIAVAPRG